MTPLRDQLLAACNRAASDNLTRQWAAIPREMFERLVDVACAAEDCVNAWGDYAPNPQTKAARVLREAKAALEALKREVGE